MLNNILINKNVFAYIYLLIFIDIYYARNATWGVNQTTCALNQTTFLRPHIWSKVTLWFDHATQASLKSQSNRHATLSSSLPSMIELKAKQRSYSLWRLSTSSLELLKMVVLIVLIVPIVIIFLIVLIVLIMLSDSTQEVLPPFEKSYQQSRSATST